MTFRNEHDIDAECPKCGRRLTQCEWWDDPPEIGGGYLDDRWWCFNCDTEYERHESPIREYLDKQDGRDSDG